MGGDKLSCEMTILWQSCMRSMHDERVKKKRKKGSKATAGFGYVSKGWENNSQNQMGKTTDNLTATLLHRLLHSCIPIAFSHTKYRGVHANPNVMDWWMRKVGADSLGAGNAGRDVIACSAGRGETAGELAMACSCTWGTGFCMVRLDLLQENRDTAAAWWTVGLAPDGPSFMA